MRMLAPALALSAAPLAAQSDPLTLRVEPALDGRGGVLANVVRAAPRMVFVMKDGRVYESWLR